MWHDKMCKDRSTSSRLGEVQSKLKLARVQERDRSPSPIPGIQKALFKAGVSIESGKSHRRGSKRSLEEELKEYFDEKENRRDWKRAGQDCRSYSSVFKFPPPVPAINVQTNYDVVSDSVHKACPLC